MLKYIALHETAVSRSVPNQFWAVNRYHKEKFGVISKSGLYVGYHTFIDTNGSVTKVREFGEESSAVIGHNCDVPERCDTISVCLAFNGDTELPNDAQLKSLKNHIAEIKGQYPEVEVVFHRTLQHNRTCPGALITPEYLKTVILKSDRPNKSDEDIEKQKKIREIVSEISIVQALVDKLVAYFKKIK